jgi:hypothetical protein
MGKHKIIGNNGVSSSDQLRDKVNNEHYYALYRNRKSTNSRYFNKSNETSLQAKQGDNNKSQYSLRGKEHWN